MLDDADPTEKITNLARRDSDDSRVGEERNTRAVIDVCVCVCERDFFLNFFTSLLQWKVF